MQVSNQVLAKTGNWNKKVHTHFSGFLCDHSNPEKVLSSVMLSPKFKLFNLWRMRKLSIGTVPTYLILKDFLHIHGSQMNSDRINTSLRNPKRVKLLGYRPTKRIFFTPLIFFSQITLHLLSCPTLEYIKHYRRALLKKLSAALVHIWSMPLVLLVYLWKKL